MAYLQPDRGLFLSILDEINRPGQVVRNLIRGDVGAAGRQAGQFGINLADALLPGDWLPNEVARKEDYVSGHELVGGYEDAGSKALGFGIDVLTDPLTYIPGAFVAKGAKLAGGAAVKGAEKVIGKQAVETIGRGVRETFNKQRLTPATRSAVDKARAVQSGVSQAQVRALDEILKGTTEEQQGLLGEVFLNIKRDTAGRADSLIDATEQMTVAQRAAQHFAGRTDAQRLSQIVDELSGFSRRQFEEGRDVLGIFKPGQGVEEYFPRQFSGMKQTADEAGQITQETLYGRPSPVKERTLKTDADVLATLKGSPELGLEFNVQKALGKRAEQQGKLAARGSLGQSMTGKGFSYADEKSRSAFEASLKQLPPEDAQVVSDLYHGLKPRGAFTNLLAKSNAIFKPYATAGYLIPKIGFNVRNRLSAIWQTLSNEEARGATGGMLKRFLSDTGGAIADAMGLSIGDKLGKTVRLWDDALKTSGGSYEKALATMRAQDANAAELIANGVMDGFVRSEDMLSAASGAGLLKKLHRGAKWTVKITKGVEDRMRLGLGLDLMAKGKTAEEAARIVRDTLFDFSVTSGKNRAFRDIVPFGNYASNAIVQQTKFLGKNPAVAVGVAEALRQDPNAPPLYPYLEQKATIPFGTDEKGNQQVVAGFGLPFESLTMLPNPSSDLGQFGRQVESGIVGSAHPILKALYSGISGRDPYFGTPYGSYDKAPIVGPAGDAGRAYNKLAGTGLIQPADSLLRTIDKALDERRSLGGKALDMLTGANVVSVDPDKALQQQLMRALDRNPNIAQITTPINVGGDPELDALLKELRDAKKRIREKKAAASQ